MTYLIRIGSLLSWLTVFLIPKKSIKRFIPVTILSALITVTVTFIGSNYAFWDVKSGGTKRKMWNLLSLVLGYFPLGCLWIFHLTFGKFPLFLLVVFFKNLFFGFGVIPVLEKLNFIQYVKFTRIHHVVVTIIYSLILYKYQLFFDKPTKR
ncbi:hypothetical protein CVD27_12875 [Neobacillus cucumis]|uniref:Uncharacterized protein n=1 Tax=Neobacillus cucumis TaxID=1740721 RepID=A0A2N5HET4_9BACI|nr:hypothetical protein CVD27_12875 [Neobacillus cucumis]